MLQWNKPIKQMKQVKLMDLSVLPLGCCSKHHKQIKTLWLELRYRSGADEFPAACLAAYLSACLPYLCDRPTSCLQQSWRGRMMERQRWCTGGRSGGGWWGWGVFMCHTLSLWQEGEEISRMGRRYDGCAPAVEKIKDKKEEKERNRKVGGCGEWGWGLKPLVCLGTMSTFRPTLCLTFLLVWQRANRKENNLYKHSSCCWLQRRLEQENTSEIDLSDWDE